MEERQIIDSHSPGLRRDACSRTVPCRRSSGSRRAAEQQSLCGVQDRARVLPQAPWWCSEASINLGLDVKDELTKTRYSWGRGAGGAGSAAPGDTAHREELHGLRRTEPTYAAVHMHGRAPTVYMLPLTTVSPGISLQSRPSRPFRSSVSPASWAESLTVTASPAP